MSIVQLRAETFHNDVAPLPADVPVPNPLPKLLAGEDLPIEDAEHLFERLVLGRLEPAEIAGMLIALRMKGETAEEMIGAAHALSAAALPFERPDYLFADCCGTGGIVTGLGVRAGGIASGGASSLRGISIGMSTGIGRGCVSNTSGKPTIPITTSTAAPIRRCRARTRACWTASAVSLAALPAAGVSARRLKMDSKPMRCEFQ